VALSARTPAPLRKAPFSPAPGMRDFIKLSFLTAYGSYDVMQYGAGSRAGFLKSPPFPPSGANMATAGRQARPPSCKALSRRHSFEVFQGVTGSSRRRSGRCQPTLSDRAGRLIQARGKRKSDGRAKGFTWGAQKPTRPSRLYPLGGAPNGHRTACNILLRAAEVKACMLQNLYRCVVKDRSFQARRR
jgi:hypothetical protein